MLAAIVVLSWQLRMASLPVPASLTQQILHPETTGLDPEWLAVLQQPAVAQARQDVAAFLARRLAEGAVIYPPHPWRALALTPARQTRVVILGQDPYHGQGQAQGLAFSVPDAMKRPPSLRNMFLEIARDDGARAALPEIPAATAIAHWGNDLTRWAEQGVLLLNTVMTVEDGQPAAHAKRGWEIVTDALIRHIADRAEPAAFLLWGGHAQAKQALLPAGQGHLVLCANHPSPLSARRPPVPFLGCGHFRRVNEWLAERHLPAIAWRTDTSQAGRQEGLFPE